MVECWTIPVGALDSQVVGIVGLGHEAWGWETRTLTRSPQAPCPGPRMACFAGEFRDQ